MFGLSIMTDAYVVAQTIPRLSAAAMEGVLNYTFLPVFIEYKNKKGEGEAWAIANTIFSFSLIILAVLSILIVIFAPQITSLLAPGFSLESSQMSNYLLRVMSPLLILVFLSLLLTSIFHAYNQFSIPSILSLLPQAGGVAALLVWSHRWGIVSLPAGFLLACTTQFVILFFYLRYLNQPIRPYMSVQHPGVRQIGRLIGPRFLGFSLESFNLLVDRFFASLLGTGFISALTYAQTIVLIPHTFIVGSIGKAIMPTLSSHSSYKEYEEMRRLISTSIRMVSFITIPIIFFIAFFREELIRLLFQRGAFTEEANHLTAVALLYYSLCVFGFSINPILKGALFALQDTVTPVKIGFITLIANAILDFVLMKYMGHGGIALATSIVITISTVAFWMTLSKKIGALHPSEIIGSMIRVSLVSLTIGLILRVIYSNVTMPHDSYVWNIVKMVTLLIMGGLLFFGSCILLNIREYKEITGIMKKRQKKKEIRYEIALDE